MERVLVAMSGGVDSAAAAVLLREQGVETAGGTMLLHEGGEDAARDAKAVCESLKIPHFVFDLRREFRREVIRPFGERYLRGETPNPCVLCNRTLKFGAFLSRAEALGYGKIATGHYAKILRLEDTGRWTVIRAEDLQKDQSYVLYGLTQDQLSRTLFPLGGRSKPEIRALAARAGLSVADRPESQDICFIPEGDYGAYLEHALGLSSPPGDFVDEYGNVLGRHRGLHRYTVGQRRGLGVSSGGRLYVLRKDVEKNQVVLGENSGLYPAKIRVRDLNWTAIAPPEGPLEAQVMTRYRSRTAKAVLRPLGEELEVEFLEPQRAPAPGQAAVFYRGEVLLGGGTIGV